MGRGGSDVELPEECQDVSPEPVDQVASTPVEDVPSALPALSGGSLDGEALPEPLVEPDDLRAVLRPDSIPAIDDPKFLPPECVLFDEEIDGRLPGKERIVAFGREASAAFRMHHSP